MPATATATATSSDAPQAAPASRRQVTEKDMASDRMSIKAALDAMEKMPVRLVAKPKDQCNYETVQINGYLIQIKRGEQVYVPKLVYELLEAANLI